jgi:hypothetical protein
MNAWMNSLSRLEYGSFCLVVAIGCFFGGLGVSAVIW